METPFHYVLIGVWLNGREYVTLIINKLKRCKPFT